MFEMITQLATNATQNVLDANAVIATTTQIIPGLANSQLLVIGQIMLGLLIVGLYLLHFRNLKIGKLLVRDKTIMFTGFLTKEDYERVISAKGHLFALVPDEVVKEVNNAHNFGTTIIQDPETRHMKKEENNSNSDSSLDGK